MMAGLACQVVPATADHLGLITSNWLHSLWTHCEWARSMRKSVFYDNHEPLIKRILKRAETVVACEHGDPWHAYGWLCYEGPGIIHYAYVKPYYRRRGVFTTMVLAAGLREGVQHSQPLPSLNPSVDIQSIRRKMKAEFNPYLVIQ